MSEKVLRSTAYFACLYTFGLFATAMGMTTMHVSGMTKTSSCQMSACTALLMPVKMTATLKKLPSTSIL